MSKNPSQNETQKPSAHPFWSRRGRPLSYCFSGRGHICSHHKPAPTVSIPNLGSPLSGWSFANRTRAHCRRLEFIFSWVSRSTVIKRLSSLGRLLLAPLYHERATNLVTKNYSPKSNLLSLLDFSMHGGERGIRTLGTLLTYTRFPSVRLKPLGHLSCRARWCLRKGLSEINPPNELFQQIF